MTIIKALTQAIISRKTLSDQQAMVTEFHRKHSFAVDQALIPTPSLAGFAERLAALAAELADGTDGSLARCRLHLIVEEVAELAAALQDGDEVATLDALADLTYVTVGTAVAYGLPLAEAFTEVHASNMTKSIGGEGRLWHPVKGTDYRPPDLVRVLRESKWDDLT